MFESPKRHHHSNDTLSRKSPGERRKGRNAGSARGSRLGGLPQGTGSAMMLGLHVQGPLSAQKPKTAPDPQRTLRGSNFSDVAGPDRNKNNPEGKIARINPRVLGLAGLQKDAGGLPITFECLKVPSSEGVVGFPRSGSAWVHGVPGQAVHAGWAVPVGPHGDCWA